MNNAPQPTPSSVELVVLAGGSGRRLGGVFKPMLRHPSGETLLGRTLSALAPWNRRVAVVAPHWAWFRISLPEGVRQVIDAGEGPPGALYAAAESGEAAWLLVVAADHVSPQAALADALAQRASAGVEAVVARRVHREPLFAFYRRDAVLSVRRPASLQRLLDRLRTVVVREDVLGARTRSLEDLDEPEDLERFGIRKPRSG